MMFDAHGVKHGQSEEGFAWVFRIPDGVVAIQEITTLNKMNALAESFRSWQGSNQFWLSAPLIPDIDDETLERAWNWWADCYDAYPGLEEGSITLLEFMQEVNNLTRNLTEPLTRCSPL